MENVPSPHNVGIDFFAHVCHRGYWVGTDSIIREMWERTNVARIALWTLTIGKPYGMQDPNLEDTMLAAGHLCRRVCKKIGKKTF